MIVSGKNRWKMDRKLTACMVEDMIFDPILAAKVLLKIKVPPHEELRILWMWTKYFTSDDSGFSTGKSFTLAVVSALRSILIRDRISGIISKTFAQGQLIFANYDRWYNSCSIFRNLIKHYGKKPRLVHGSSAWVAYFRGGSEIRTLPPDFFKDSERVRSERWNDGYFDEWTSYGNFNALNKTMFGRCTKENHFPDCPVRQNHIHLSSTPSFEFHPSFDQIKKINYQIVQGNDDYGRFTCNYRHIPDTEEYRWLVSRKTIFNMQVSLPANIAKAEVDGIWQKDSGTFYSMKDISDCRSNMQLFSPVRKNTDEIFIAGVDVARSKRKTGRKGGGDDFSLTVFRKQNRDSHPIHCNTVRKNGITAHQMSGIIHKWHSRYGFSLIVIDILGGGLFVLDELKKPEQVIENKTEYVNPLIEIDDFYSGSIGSNIVIPTRRSVYHIEQMWGKMQSDSVFVNRIHNSVKNAIEKRNIILGGKWNGWNSGKSEWDIDSKREWLNRNASLSEKESVEAEMDLAVQQLSLVDIVRDRYNEPIIDTFGMFRFGSKHKKDSAYSLIYSYLGCMIFDSMTERNVNVNRSGLMVSSSCPI